MVRTTFHPTASWWRIGPAWAVIAAALSLPLGDWDAPVLLRVLTAVLLADPIWGAFWHAARQGGDEVAPTTTPIGRGPVPYAAPGAPAVRLLAWLHGGASAAGPDRVPHAAAGWPVALLLALLLALGLGPVALALTGVAVGLSLLRLLWTRHDQSPPAVLDTVLVVGLPWLLGMTAVRDGQLAFVLLAAAFCLLVWGVLRAEQGLRYARTLMGLGQAAVLLVLVWQRLPLAAGLVGACFLLPWWLLAWAPGTPGGILALRAAQAWFLAAMLLSVIIRS